MNHAYNSKEYWAHDTKNNNSNYKSFIFFHNIGKTLKLPTGLKVQLGVGNGYTLNEMKKFWGAEHVLGIDLYNFDHDPSVFATNIKDLKVCFPCSYIENDIGSTAFLQSKLDRWHATQWGIKCLVPGGVFITNSGHMIDQPVEQYAMDHECTVTSLSEYDELSWAQYLNQQTAWRTKNWCIIKKRS